MTSEISSRARTVAIAIIAVLLFSACASDGPRGNRGGGPGGRGGNEAQMNERGGGLGGSDFNALYRDTLERKARGECESTLDPLLTLSRQGPGYEGAQQALGECLLQNAGPDAVTDQLDALVWLRRAAEGGRTQAQGALAAVYLDGPEALRNQNQALFWYALYKDNASRGQVAFVALAPETEARLANTFSDSDLASVSAAVATWQPTVWIPPKEPALAGSGRDRDGGRERQQRRQIAEGL